MNKSQILDFIAFDKMSKLGVAVVDFVSFVFPQVSTR